MNCEREVQFDLGIDNPSQIQISPKSSDSDSEIDSGYAEPFVRNRRHKNSIVSTASFERKNFLSLLRRDDKELAVDREERRFSRSRTFSLHDDLDEDKEDKRFKAYLHNKFGTKGSEVGQIRNGTGIYHIYNGTVVVTDVLNSCLLVYTASGRLIKCIPVPRGSEPWTTSATPSGEFAVSLSRKKCISVLTQSGAKRFEFGDEVLQYPSGVIVDRRNRFIVSDTKLDRVFIFSDEGDLIRTIPDEDSGSLTLKYPRHVSLSHSGNIIVSDSGNHCIRVFDRHGDHIRDIGKYGSDDGELKFPHGVCTDHEDNIIVADYYNNRISIFSKDGTFLQHLITSHMGLKRPHALTIRFFRENYIIFVTHGDTKGDNVAAYRIVDSKLRQHMKAEIHASV